MTGHGSKFARKKEQAITALLTNRSVEEAAKAAGVGPKTLMRWMKLPEFAEAYRNARRQAFGQSIARLQQASSAAVSTLLKVMIDGGAPPSTRLRAADSVLHHGARAIELEEIEARLAKLERTTVGSAPVNGALPDATREASSTAEFWETEPLPTDATNAARGGTTHDEPQTQA